MNPQLIRLHCKDPLQEQADVLIHPTCAVEAPEGERFQNFYKQTGENVLTQVQKDQPVRIGEAIITPGGNLSVNQIVHVPVRTGPGVPTTLENIQVAYRTAMVKADEDPHRTVIVPAPVRSGEIEEKIDPA